MIFKKNFIKSFISIIFMSFLPAFAADVPVPMNAQEIFEYSKVLYNTNNKQEALKTLLSAPKDYRGEEINLLISNIYSENQDLDKAIEYLNKSIEINENYYRAYYNLGVIYQKKNDALSAIQNYKTAIKKNREFAYSYYNLGCLYLSLNNYKQAKSNFVKALAYKNNDKDFYYNLAYAYKKLGNTKNANKILNVYNKL